MKENRDRMQSPREGQRDPGIRKAAILVTSLDMATADLLLDQLDPAQAARIRQATMDLGEIDAQEQRRVLDEFFRVGPMIPGPNPSGIELDSRLARKLGAAPLAAASARADGDSPGPEPFEFLHEAEAEKLTRILAEERPQTIALVLSHLPPSQAGQVLARLQPGLQVDVVHRLVDLEETDPDVLREIEGVLQTRLAKLVGFPRKRVVGLTAVANILQSADSPVHMQILNNLAVRDPRLAEQLSAEEDEPETEEPMDFGELGNLDDATLVAVFQAAEPEVAVMALVGAAPDLVDRLLRRLPAPRASRLRTRLGQPGPLRLSDIAEAQQAIAALAQKSSRRVPAPSRPRDLAVA